MEIDRTKIVAKIRALLAKTTENGATEPEMMAALEKARAMMDAYEVTAEDVELKGETAKVFASMTPDPHDAKTHLCTAIATFTDCRVWRRTDGAIHFCGLETDVQLAEWLLSSLQAFVLRELTAYLIKSSPAMKGQRRRTINGFVIGCAQRISARLKALAEQSRIAQTSNGRALVVAKGKLVAAKMAELGIQLRKAKRITRRTTWDSFNAGQAAGNRASLGRPVSGGAAAAPRLN